MLVTILAVMLGAVSVTLYYFVRKEMDRAKEAIVTDKVILRQRQDITVLADQVAVAAGRVAEMEEQVSVMAEAYGHALSGLGDDVEEEDVLSVPTSTYL